MPVLAQSPRADAGANVLAGEVASRGWILFSTKTGQGDYDLFLSRPDGSSRRNLTQTLDANEFGGGSRRTASECFTVVKREAPRMGQTQG